MEGPFYLEANCPHCEEVGLILHGRGFADHYWGCPRCHCHFQPLGVLRLAGRWCSRGMRQIQYALKQRKVTQVKD
jgi:hypothetical protein